MRRERRKQRAKRLNRLKEVLLAAEVLRDIPPEDWKKRATLETYRARRDAADHPTPGNREALQARIRALQPLIRALPIDLASAVEQLVNRETHERNQRRQDENDPKAARRRRNAQIETMATDRAFNAWKDAMRGGLDKGEGRAIAEAEWETAVQELRAKTAQELTDERQRLREASVERAKRLARAATALLSEDSALSDAPQAQARKSHHPTRRRPGTPSRRNAQEQTHHDSVVEQVRIDYGFDEAQWPKTREQFAAMPTEALVATLAPGAEHLRSTWTTCSECGEQHPDLEPVERPAYQEALKQARKRDALRQQGHPHETDARGLPH